MVKTLVLAMAIAGIHGYVRAQGGPDPAQARPTNSPPHAQMQPPNRLALQGFGATVDFRVLSVLTPEQRSSLQALVRSRQAEARRLEETLRKTRKEVLDLGLSGKFDEKDIRQKARAAGDSEADWAVFRARLLADMKPALTEEQIAKIRTPGRAARELPQVERPRARPNTRLLSQPTNSTPNDKAP